jgi:hypothetical protein
LQVIFGEQELKDGKVQIKTLATKEEELVSIDNLAAELFNRGALSASTIGGVSAGGGGAAAGGSASIAPIHAGAVENNIGSWDEAGTALAYGY